MEQKDVYEEKVAAQLAEWQARIDELRAKARRQEAEAKEQYSSEIEKLEARRDAAMNQFEELRKAGEGAWTDLKTGLDRAVSDLSQTFDNIVSRFKP